MSSQNRPSAARLGQSLSSISEELLHSPEERDAAKPIKLEDTPLYRHSGTRNPAVREFANRMREVNDQRRKQSSFNKTYPIPQSLYDRVVAVSRENGFAVIDIIVDALERWLEDYKNLANR